MPIKYPVRKYLGKYESWLLHLYGRKSMLYNDKYLERFFDHFPQASGLEQFGTPDVLEYKNWRESTADISTFKVMQEIKCLDRFYRYLIEDVKLPLSNPAKPFVKHINLKHIVRRKKDSLRLEEYKSLFETCIKYQPRLVHWMVWMVQGVGSHDRHMTSQKAGRLFKKVAVLAGLPYVTMQLVKRSLRNGLWREIIKDWSNRVLTDNGYVERHHARPEHTELPGDAFAHVQVSADDVWASICDSCDDILLIPSNEQQSPEPQSP